MPHLGHSPTPAELPQLGGSLPLAHGVFTVRYPIPERIFDYVSTVRSATAGTCDEAKFGGALLDHVVGEGEERRGQGTDTQRSGRERVSSSHPTTHPGVSAQARKPARQVDGAAEGHGLTFCGGLGGAGDTVEPDCSSLGSTVGTDLSQSRG
jgi:hypothetical protein